MTTIARRALDLLDVVRARARGRAPKKLLLLYLDVTAQCNLACGGCGIASFRAESADGPELSTGLIKDLLRQASELGTWVVSFGGGEPLLREDMVELIACARKYGLRSHVNTNGMLIDAVMAQKLFGAGLGMASVSIDGPTAEVHEIVRGVGTFAPAVEAVRNLRKAAPGIPICINTVICKQNLSEVESMIELAHELDADQLKFTPLDANLMHQHKPSGAFCVTPLDRTDTAVANAVIERLRFRAKRDWILANSDPFLLGIAKRLTGVTHTRCLAGYLFVTVDPWGRVFPCYDLRTDLKVTDQPLDQIWRSEELDAARRQVNLCDRRCWDIGSAEPSLLLDMKILRGKKRAISQAMATVRGKGRAGG
jgi:AdoMet-dependent heme synthase